MQSKWITIGLLFFFAFSLVTSLGSCKGTSSKQDSVKIEDKTIEAEKPKDVKESMEETSISDMGHEEMETTETDEHEKTKEVVTDKAEPIKAPETERVEIKPEIKKNDSKPATTAQPPITIQPKQTTPVETKPAPEPPEPEPVIQKKVDIVKEQTKVSPPPPPPPTKDDPPIKAEEKITTPIANSWIVPAKNNAQVNPVKADSESLDIGRTLYKKHCASCHGKTGLGDGPKAGQLETSAGDFTLPIFQNQTDGALFYKTWEGRDEMPNYKKKIPDAEDIWHLVNYLRSFK